MSRGSFLGRKPVGLHEDWHPNGSISAIETYSEDGRADGPFEYYDESGNPQRKGSYVDGVKHGHWLEYWDGGRIRSEGVLDSGDRQGRWTYYDSISGSVDLRRSGEYVDDERVGD